MSSQVFTPLNFDKTDRLYFNEDDVKVLSGALHQRRLGLQAVVEIEGKRYEVHGEDCGLSNCACDAVLKPVDQPEFPAHMTLEAQADRHTAVLRMHYCEARHNIAAIEAQERELRIQKANYQWWENNILTELNRRGEDIETLKKEAGQRV